jgi:hypothetical protein
LLLWVRKGVKGFKDRFSKDLILDTDYRSQKDVVQSLGFNPHIQLLHSKAQASHELFHGAEHTTESRLNKPIEFTPFFNNADLGRGYGKEARNAHGNKV